MCCHYIPNVKRVLIIVPNQIIVIYLLPDSAIK